MILPAFIISDQDKGLLPALAKVFPEIMHFYCFQHLMENFNKTFKCKKLQNLAWKIQFSRIELDFKNSTQELKKLNEAAVQWLMNIPVEKWSILYSPIPRFSGYTPNNVESINSARKATRKLLITDLLID
jgi:hypothetical protein